MTDIQLVARSLSSASAIRHPWLATLVVVVLLVGCSKGDNDLGPWKEEIKLSDGRIIVVERFESFDVTRPMGDPGSAFVAESRIRIVAPPELAYVPELTLRQRPVILDYDVSNGVWFAIGVNDRACGPEALRAGHMNSKGTINLHPNFEYRLIDGLWQSVDIGPERLGLPANLLIQRMTIDRFEVLPLAEKARIDSDNRIPSQFQSVQPHIGCG